MVDKAPKADKSSLTTFSLFVLTTKTEPYPETRTKLLAECNYNLFHLFSTCTLS